MLEVKNPPANAGGSNLEVHPLSQKDPLEQEITATPGVLPGSHNEQETCWAIVRGTAEDLT